MTAENKKNSLDCIQKWFSQYPDEQPVPEGGKQPQKEEDKQPDSPEATDRIKDATQKRKLRAILSWFIMGASTIWIIFLMVIISIAGCQNVSRGLGYGCFLSDKVLITLISTHYVFSLVTIILKYCFPKE